LLLQQEPSAATTASSNGSQKKGEPAAEKVCKPLETTTSTTSAPCCVLLGPFVDSYSGVEFESSGECNASSQLCGPLAHQHSQEMSFVLSSTHMQDWTGGC
jgi:hypothetical protein